MAVKRHYGYTTIFGARIANMKHLWVPSTEYKGQATTKPNYLATFIVAKTRQAWWEEPIFAGYVAACTEVCNASGLSMQHVSEWPIRDGDIPGEPGREPAEWTKGQWVFSGTSSNPPNVTIAQNGAAVPLANRALVKPGDFVAAGMAVAIKTTNARELKSYLNSVLFMAAGEEIVIGNSVSGAELMRQAQAQGLQVAGFGQAPANGGFPGGAQAPGPGAGFGGVPGPANFPGPGGAPNSNFAPQTQNTAPQGGGFAPTGPGSFIPPGGGFPGR